MKNKIIMKFMTLIVAFIFALGQGGLTVLASDVKIGEKNNKPEHNVVVKENKKYINKKHKQYGEYEKKVVDEQLKKHTGVLNNELEDELNEIGVLDEEIAELDSEAIENLNSAEKIQVQVSFFEEDGTDIVEISDDKESYYKEYYEKNYKKSCKEENKKSITDKILEGIGVKPIEVYADYKESKDKKITPKMKQTLFLIQDSDINGFPGAYYVYTAEWLSTPKYNRKDYIFISFENGVHCIDKTYYRFSYTKKEKKIIGHNDEISEKISNISKSSPTQQARYLGETSYHIFVQELPGGDSQEEYYNMYSVGVCYEKQKFIICGYVRMYNKSKDIGTITMNVYYKHQKCVKNLDWSGVSISCTGDISIGFDVNNKNYYEGIGSLHCEIFIVYK